MSHLLIQQNELIHQFGPDTQLATLISHFENEFQKQGEVICKVHINELPLNEAEEEKFAQTPLKFIQSFEIETENPTHLLNEVIRKWEAELPKLILSADQVAEKLRFTGLEKSYTHFSQFIDACHYLVSSLTSIRTLVSIDQLGAEAEWLAAEKNLWKCFDDLMSSFNSKDNNLIADIIEYDLADTLQTWLVLLNSVCKDKLTSK